MSESSLIGVPSCFSGGRRIVKWTRSMAVSDFRRLRQARSPACGSPETSSTRRFSRMPSMTWTARLFAVVISPSSGATSNCRILLPPRGTVKSSGMSVPGSTVSVAISLPLRRTVTRAVSPGPAPSSTTRNFSSCCSPTMPKRGALTTSMRRSNSSGRPVMSAWTGASKLEKAEGAGMSCTWPSVMKIAPPTRERGTSAMAELRASKRRVEGVSEVPSSPASTMRGSMRG